jgi:hypothetical protein
MKTDLPVGEEEWFVICEAQIPKTICMGRRTAVSLVMANNKATETEAKNLNKFLRGDPLEFGRSITIVGHLRPLTDDCRTQEWVKDRYIWRVDDPDWGA